MDTGVKEVELRDLWRRYKDQGDDSARERLVVAMGTLFKVLAMRHPDWPEPAGFA